MAFCVATAVLQMRMTVAEAVRAATWGGARALRRESGAGAVGLLRPGARADLHVLDAPSATHLAYRPGDRKSTRLNSSHLTQSRMPSSA